MISKSIWHIVTGEYPPVPGGVGDYSRSIADGLAVSGDDVHIWCGPHAGPLISSSRRVTVHRLAGNWTPKNLIRLSSEIDRFATPRKLLIQYTPGNFGCQGVNLPFAFWVWSRAVRHRDRVWAMFHEFGLGFGPNWKQNAIAVIHRIMGTLIAQAAVRAWASIPRIAEQVHRHRRFRQGAVDWLPIPSNIPVHFQTESNWKALREQLKGNAGHLVGHFGSYTPQTTGLLLDIIPVMLRHCADTRMMLLGHGGDRFARQLAANSPDVASRIAGLGGMPAADLSNHVQVCDVMLQPYPDGVSSRRTSLMAALQHRLPVVTNVGPSSESVWRDRAALSLVPTEASAKHYATAIERLLSAPSLRAHMGESAGRLYQEQFDIRHTIQRLRN
jgi:glycosyltransferase involved in cell wall biosynthesis